MGRAYYNEVDAYAAQWLRNLVAAGLVPAGDVDDRSIADVQPGDLAGYTQCHFFAGIGGWSLALHLAGWPDDREVWTGSCPCQPFSVAGKQKGFADERHLWPEFRRLIAERRPAVVFGEQVASALAWFDAVSTDLEREGYAVAAAVVPACAVAAPHMRDRLWFLADASSARSPFRVAPPRSVGEAYPGQAGVHSARHDGATWHPWPTEPGMGCLAHGVPARVAKLRAFGNAIVPQVGAAFVQAYLDASPVPLSAARRA